MIKKKLKGKELFLSPLLPSPSHFLSFVFASEFSLQSAGYFSNKNFSNVVKERDIIGIGGGGGVDNQES